MKAYCHDYGFDEKGEYKTIHDWIGEYMDNYKQDKPYIKSSVGS